eukprot:CAMPEP_0185035268 /NCGR_PEP_ID=MMETSP1103-20130426/26339_1 /TAXON_ID=36769 /ORGANISM="Paraphysomonas bandaiensis, Strain Caron Lab Isolate" /LENGTH=949 /DNA_ID=CAMNT_0027572273 /DNA_START=23 /DNA_END=2869 /DNA_ORIENTATION=-
MHRPNYNTPKPENVLKRVDELISSSTGSNADKEKRYALEQLHNLISSKKKTWQKVYEEIMKRHMELCVDLKDHRTAKDGLHQYRNMAQSTEPGSLEVVILHLVELAEARANAARVKANKVALAAAAKVSDLDQEETPESIMLSTMTVEGVKDRTDREVVVPWLKFLWETYRAILELLHKNAKLDRVYHKTSEKAFAFCMDYHRTLEFRRLCEMLRTQLSNLMKNASQPARSNRAVWEWTPESIEIHLQIRFHQLEVATTMEQWNEGFRTVEDIYTIMQLGKKTPKPRLMATYYEKLTRIFWVSENHLFHAHAWYKYYTLCCEYRKDIKPEEKSLMASSVLLSALCIPTVSDKKNVAEEEEASAEKNQQMAMLLDFQANPTRHALLAEIVAKGVLSEVDPSLRSLYDLVEGRFRPLALVKDLMPVLAIIKDHPQLSMYASALQKVAVLRCTLQLSTVYTSLRVDFVKKLFAPLNLDYVTIERILVEGLNRHQLRMSIDHFTGCYRFGTVVDVAPVVETQLPQVGSKLQQVAERISGKAVDATVMASRRKAYLELIEDASKNQHSVMLERKTVIERRKEGFERLQREKMALVEQRKADEEQQRKIEEDRRLKEEEEIRAMAKVKKHNDEKQIQRMVKVFESLGKNVEESTLRDMDEGSRRELLAQAQLEKKKEKEAEAKRLAEQARSLDFTTRAFYIEASKIMCAKYKEKVEQEKKDYDARVENVIACAKEKHAEMLEDKKRILRIKKFRAGYESIVVTAQRKKYDEDVVKLRELAWEEHRKANVARARFLYNEEIEQREEQAEIEREREQKLELERIQAQQHEELRLQREADLEARAREDELKAAEAARRVEEEHHAIHKEAGGWRQARDRVEPDGPPASSLGSKSSAQWNRGPPVSSSSRPSPSAYRPPHDRGTRDGPEDEGRWGSMRGGSGSGFDSRRSNRGSENDRW